MKHTHWNVGCFYFLFNLRYSCLKRASFFQNAAFVTTKVDFLLLFNHGLNKETSLLNLQGQKTIKLLRLIESPGQFLRTLQGGA